MDRNALYDVVIVGGGPAGLTAALYLARARYRVVVVERERLGGQIALTGEVANYPGVARASGADLAQAMRDQAASFGAEFLLAEATGLDMAGDVKTVHTTQGDLSCFAVLLATGARPRTVGFAGEEEFRGRGVTYCATCDGEFFAGKDVFVVGGGFAAAEESVFLATHARHVTILMRKGDFSCAAAVAEPARANPKITVLPHTEVVEVAGDSVLRRLRYRNNQTGEETVYEAPEGDTFGVFVLAGYDPASDLARGLAETDGQGHLLVDAAKQTGVSGLFAAGDVCAKSLRQVVTAVGEAAEATDAVARLCAELREKTGLVPERPGAGTHGNPGGHARGSAGAPGRLAPETQGDAGEPGLFDAQTRAQLDAVFSRMAAPLTLELHLDESPAAHELERYMTGLAALTDRLTVTRVEDPADEHRPFVSLVRADGEACGVRFHGVPGGHEFASFILGLYNAAGPGQPLDDATRAAVAAIARPVHLSVIVTLTCSMCPDLVQAAERIAALNPQVTTDVYDAIHYPDLRARYNIMSVPCLVVTEADGSERVSFGRKSLEQLLDHIG